MIFVALTLPNLPGLLGTPSNLGLGVSKPVALFHKLEMLSNHLADARVAAALAVRGL